MALATPWLFSKSVLFGSSQTLVINPFTKTLHPLTDMSWLTSHMLFVYFLKKYRDGLKPLWPVSVSFPVLLHIALELTDTSAEMHTVSCDIPSSLQEDIRMLVFAFNYIYINFKDLFVHTSLYSWPTKCLHFRAACSSVWFSLISCHLPL